MSTTHIAGLDVLIEGRFLRQRCGWCGVIVTDYDLASIAMPLNPDGSPPVGPGAWKVGAMVRTDGPASYVVDEDRLPDDWCGSVEIAVLA